MRLKKRVRRRAAALAKQAAGRAGYRLEPASWRDYGAEINAILDRVDPYTMVSGPKIADACMGVRYVVERDVPGAIVECGVWRGGVVMAMALQLLALGDTSRELWLYDTFAGMTEPTDADVSVTGKSATSNFDAGWKWAPASVQEVAAAVASTGYPTGQCRLIEGRVEDTIPSSGAPDQIAVLRLDTDWYDSTKHELEHLWPRLAPGGVLLLDDYGHWLGARKAVDEYVAEHGIRLFLQRSEPDGRIAVKQ